MFLHSMFVRNILPLDFQLRTSDPDLPANPWNVTIVLEHLYFNYQDRGCIASINVCLNNKVRFSLALR